MRLFAAIPLPDFVQAELLNLFAPMDGAKWVEEGAYHLTLEFFGEVNKHELVDLTDAFAAMEWNEFDLTLQSVGYFGSQKTPRVLYAGVNEVEELTMLHKKIHRIAKEIGLTLEERKFKPHVTLARLKGTPYEHIGPFMAQFSLFKTRPFTIKHFHIYRSHLGASSAYYEILETLHSKES